MSPKSTEHKFSRYEFGKPSVRAVCTCGVMTTRSPNRTEARKKLRRHIDKAAEYEAKMAEHIKKLVDKAPPLSDDQRARLAVLLRVGEG